MPPADTFGREGSYEEHVCFPLEQGLVERPVFQSAGRQSARQSNRQPVDAVKVSTVLIDMIPEPMDSPVPTGLAMLTVASTTRQRQMASEHNFSMEEVVLTDLDFCDSVVGGPTSTCLAEVASSADLAEVVSSADLAGDVTVGVMSPLLRREYKRRFRDMQAGVCAYCGRHIMHDMARHVSIYHLDLEQLWQCPVSWCSHWKETPQDCIDHIRLQHHVGLSVKTTNLGKWFPPWTVTQTAWNAALKPNVSGISNDMVLFSEHGAQLVHHYRVYSDCVSHGSLRGTFMAKLMDFTNRACAEVRSVTKRGRDPSTGPGISGA